MGGCFMQFHCVVTWGVLCFREVNAIVFGFVETVGLTRSDKETEEQRTKNNGTKPGPQREAAYR